MECFVHLQDKLGCMRTALLSIPVEVLSSLCREEANIATHVSMSQRTAVSCQQTKETPKGKKKSHSLPSSLSFCSSTLDLLLIDHSVSPKRIKIWCHQCFICKITWMKIKMLIYDSINVL